MHPNPSEIADIIFGHQLLDIRPQKNLSLDPNPNSKPNETKIQNVILYILVYKSTATKKEVFEF